MADKIIIPVEFDVNRSLQTLAPAQAGLNNLSGAGDKLKNSLGGVGNALQNSLRGLASGALIGGATALIASLAVEFLNAGKKATFFGEAVRAATEKAGAEIFTLQALVAVAKDETASRQARNNAIAQLQKQYPDYLRNISLETINSDAAKKAIDDLTNSLFKKATAQALASKFAEKQVELLDAEKKLNDELKTAGGENGFVKGVIQNLKGGGGLGGSISQINEAADAVKKIKQELAELKALGTSALGDALNFDKTVKPPKEVKTKEIKIKPDQITWEKQRHVDIAVAELEVDADELKFKKFSKGLPQIGDNKKGLAGVADGVKNANDQITAGIERTEKLAGVISDTLTPSFIGFADAIRSGTDPLKSFFEGMIGAVNQLIDRLIAAALQAAVLSALGGGSFGGVFKTILGFAGGAANRTGFGGARGMQISVGGQFQLTNGGLVAAINRAKTQISFVR
jgi:hypothetical protein